MGTEFVRDLIINSAVLLALSVIYEIGFLLPQNLQFLRKYLNGLLIGVAVVAVMSVPFHMNSDPGIVFDTRSILLFSAGLVFGPVPAIFGAAIAAVFRAVTGGTGVYTGLAVIVTSTAMGILLRSWILASQRAERWFKCYLASLTNHVVMILCFFLIPMPTALTVIRAIVLPVLIIHPIVTVLLCSVLLHQIERNEAMIKISEDEDNYRSLFDDNRAVMFLTDNKTGAIVDANQAASRYYGWTRHKLRSMRIFDINTMPEAQLREQFTNAFNKKIYPMHFKHRLADGRIRDVEVFSGPIRIAGRGLIYSIVHDISDRMEADLKLQESEARFRSLVEQAPDGIFIVQDDKFLYLNQAMVRLYNAKSADELIGTRPSDRFHPEVYDEITKRIQLLNDARGIMPPTEEIHVRLDGATIHVSAAAVPLTIGGQHAGLVFVRDITRQKQLEEERASIEAKLQQQQKLEAIGTLAGGVAHEINNPVTGIMNYAQLILDSARPDDSSAEYAREIIHESERVSAIVRNLLQFSRQEKQSHSFASVSDIISQTVALIRMIFKKDQIILEIQIDDDLPPIKCRSQQIQQVLMNLLTNARDSLNDKYPAFHPDKRIIISGHLFSQDDANWVRLSIEDHGVGIQPDIGSKIYEPFFSTKPKDKGTGLGLSISYGIISDHHGTSSYETEVGQYTRFDLCLPVDNGWCINPTEVP